MKGTRIVLLVGAVAAGLLLLASLLVFLPPVQTWLARRALDQADGFRGRVERVSASLQRVEAWQLQLERPGLRLSLPSIRVELPVAQALGHSVEIKRIVAKDWILDLTFGLPTRTARQVGPERRTLWPLAAIGLAQADPATVKKDRRSSNDADVFRGLFPALHLPVDLRIKSVDLEGDVIFPLGNGRTGRAHLVIGGGGVGAKKTGVFDVRSISRVDGKDAAEAEVSGLTKFSARMDSSRDFDLFSAVTVFSTRGPAIPRGAGLKAILEAVRSDEGEIYACSVFSQEGAAKEIAQLKADFAATDRMISGSWKIDARDTDFAPFYLGSRLPKFSGETVGHFQTDTHVQQVHAQGSFNAAVENLEAINSVFSPVGPLNLAGRFDLSQTGAISKIDQLAVTISGSQSILQLEALQTVEFDALTGELRFSSSEKDIFHLKIDGLPVAWAGPWVPQISLGGDRIRGEFVATAQADGFKLRSTAPLRVDSFSVSKEGVLLAQTVEGSAEIAGNYGPRAGWSIDVSNLSLRSEGRAFFTASGKVGRPAAKGQPLKATGQFQVDLGQAVRQPALHSYAAVKQGNMNGDFSVVSDSVRQQFEVKVDLTELAMAGVRQTLPRIRVDARADFQPDGKIKFQAPLLVEGISGQSDLQLVAEIDAEGAIPAIKARVSGQQVRGEDLQILAAGIDGVRLPSSAPRSGNTNTKPFWPSQSGQLDFVFDRVIYSADLGAKDLNGRLKWEADSLVLEDLHGALTDGSQLKGRAELSFNSAAKKPYALNGQFDLDNVNPGPLLARASPEPAPTVEGRFDLMAKLSGEGEDLNRLTQSLDADLKLTSRGGKFHGFAASARGADLAKYQKTVSTVGALLEAAAGIVGATVASTGEKIRAASDIFGRLAEIDFDQLNLEVNYRAAEETKIQDFSLISPELRFIGTGSISAEPGKSWLNRPLHLELQLAVRGKQAADMKKLGLLRDEKDALGYFPVAEKIPVEGTLGKLGTNALTKLLMRVFEKP